MRVAELARLDAGRAAGIARRIAVKAAGMTAAKAWRAEHHPVAATGHMPFHGHRTCASFVPGPSTPTVAGEAVERWCAECKQLRSEPCRYALCALAEAGA